MAKGLGDLARLVLQGRLQLVEKAQETRFEKAEVPHLNIDQMKMFCPYVYT